MPLTIGNKMEGDFYIMRNDELVRFFKIKENLCEKECIYVCSSLQKKACLDYYLMLALSDKPLEDILK